MATKAFESTDRQLLNLIQSEFPLVQEPYQAIAERLDITEPDVIRRLSVLKQKNVVRQISAIFDTRRLGYRSTLVAMQFRDEDLEQAAHRINEHPGVSHNYGRTGQFNLWFTIAVPPEESLEKTVNRLGRENNALSWRILPTLRFFKIGVNFDVVRNQSNSTEYFVPDAGDRERDGVEPAGNGVDPDWNTPQPLSHRDIEVIRELQEDLPLISRPFDAMARRLGMSVEALFAYAEDMKRRKLMRRFSAVLYHRRVGFSANAMVVWKVPRERSLEVGEIMARSPHVTHCYERPTYDDWQYSHYTMIHGTSAEECERIAEEIARATDIEERQLAFSTREYKKTRVRYFV